MDRVELLLALQKRAFEKSHWHSLIGALKDLNERLFCWKPETHAGFEWMEGSIRDIVFHVTGDKLVQASQAFGDGSVTWESMTDLIRKTGVESMVEDLRAAHDRLIEALERQTEESLDQKVRTWGGKRMTAQEFFLMLIEHDLYHAGQIRYIRNIAG
ncbi:MAG: DinB family protein [Armatimonadetes bacterium]|nr:DinB family protein [Armatimonadota bacterium]